MITRTSFKTSVGRVNENSLTFSTFAIIYLNANSKSWLLTYFANAEKVQLLGGRFCQLTHFFRPLLASLQLKIKPILFLLSAKMVATFLMASLVCILTEFPASSAKYVHLYFHFWKVNNQEFHYWNSQDEKVTRSHQESPKVGLSDQKWPKGDRITSKKTNWHQK